MASIFVPRVAVVTGAAQGIGRVVALRLAADGLDIALNDMQAKTAELDEVVGEIQALGRRAIAIPANVSIDEEVQRIVEKTVAELGGIDVFIANAGVSNRSAVVDIPVETWDRVISINLRGTMLCYKYAAQQMIKQRRGGRIIGASSGHGKRGSKFLSAYSATKFAIRGLTQSTSQELAEHNITVNSYAPGIILTPLTKSDADKQFGGHHGDALAALLELPNCPRAGPDVVASIVSYLVKPEAYFISGQSISLNGGILFD